MYSYTLTRDVLLTTALRKLGVIAAGQTPTAENLSDASVALNTIVAEFRTKGMPLWARTEYTFTPTTGVYNIGVGSTLNTVFPVKLLQAYRTENNSKIPLEIVARQDFNILPSNSVGSPLKVNYQPLINTGVISLWPVPNTTNTATVTLVYQRPFDYFDSSSDVMDFPEEWYNAIIYGVAALLAPEWGIPLQDRQMLRSEAAEHLANALDNAQEDGSWFIQPERRY